MDIAFLGLGNMGAAMARNLLKAGHRLTVWNRSDGPAEALVRDGAAQAATPAAAAAGAAIVCTMLANDAAVEAVTLGEAGLASGLAEGALHVSMSTISVALADRLAGNMTGAASISWRRRCSAGRTVRRRRNCSSPLPVQPHRSSGPVQCSIAWASVSSSSAIGRPGQPGQARRQFPHHLRDRKPGRILRAHGQGRHCHRGVLHAHHRDAVLGTDLQDLRQADHGAAFSPAGFSVPLGFKDNRLVQEAAEALQVPLPMAGLVRDRFLATLARGGEELDWSAIAMRAIEDAGLDRTG